MRLVASTDPILRTACDPVERFGPDLDELVDGMRAVLARGGYGIAAPQVGVARRVFLLALGYPPGQPLVLVNPAVGLVGPVTQSVEGCLSLPGVVLAVPRHRRVDCTYQDRNGQPHRIRCGGQQARVIQHEADHLDGILITDRARERAA